LITSLTLHHYKNYASGNFLFPERLNFIVGQNGVGKTNLLDAIYYVCMARSHGTPKDKDTMQFGESFFRLEALARNATGEHNVVVKVQPGKVKEILLDGNPTGKLSDYVGFLPVVMLAPEDVVLVQGGSASRRRFLDMIACQIDKTYLEHLQRYQKLLSQRNALLRRDGFRADRTLLQTYAVAMSASAGYICEWRRKLVSEILPEVVGTYHRISATPETPGLSYASQLLTSTFEELSAMSLEVDLGQGYTTRGVHKDDMEIRLDGRPAKKFGSQGQVKSLLIALHIAQTTMLLSHTGRKPLLLLDDIFDRLDDYRSQRLIELLAQLPAAQVFISDASPAQIRDLIALSGTEAKILELTHETQNQGSTEENRKLPDYDSEEE